MVMVEEKGRVRPPLPADRAEWVRMRHALWPTEDPAELDAELGAWLSSPTRQVYVAERERGDLCGFIELGLREYAEGCVTSPVGFIEGWYVDPDVRKRGIGRALVAAGEAWARGKGCTEMGSDTWIDNALSQRAHEALGYRVAERLIAFAKRIG
jgi:aminoglycoside 6'-N-acetyltransferase I